MVLLAAYDVARFVQQGGAKQTENPATRRVNVWISAAQYSQKISRSTRKILCLKGESNQTFGLTLYGVILSYYQYSH